MPFHNSDTTGPRNPQFSGEASKMNFSFFVFFPSSLSFFYTFILMFEVSYLCPLHDIQIFFPVFPQ